MNTILIEGPDGAGKSSLAECLVERGYSLLHFGVPPAIALKSEQSIFRFYLDPMYEAHEARKKLVMDRGHLSEPIYGKIVRGKTAMTPRVEALLERYLEAIDGQIVICLPPYRVAFANWLQRKGAEYVKEAASYRKIYDGYAHLLFNQRRNHNFIWFDYTRHHVGCFAASVANFQGSPLPRGMVGSQRPRFLFVGERPGAGNENRDLPFLSPENCSGFFFDCLQEARYREHEVAFVNAIAGDGTQSDLKGLHEEFANFRKSLSCVVALGDVAKDALDQQGVKCVSLEHPQYVRRFKQRQIKQYVEALKDLRRRHK